MNDQNQLIDFTENWNGKLFCNAFSTIRKRNDEKYQLGNHYDITLKGRWCGDAEIVEIKHFTLDKMTEGVAYMDTGYCKREALELFSWIYGEEYLTVEFSYILLYRINKDVNLNKSLNDFRTLQNPDLSI